MQLYSNGDYYEEVKNAKNNFIDVWGQITENDPNFEARLHQFFDWYIFDRLLSDAQKTPISHFMANMPEFSSETTKYMYHSMTKTLRSIYRIKKIKKNNLILQDLMDKKKYTLEDCNFNFIFKPDQFIDGRLIFTGRGVILSKGFCIHPLGAARFIIKEMKAIRKSKDFPEKKKERLHDLMKRLNDMYHLHLVYKHVEIEKVYSEVPLRG
jgi:hypothetical protein